MPAGKLNMMGKRKNDDAAIDDSRAKRQRRRKRSRSEPRYANTPEKQEALKKLFGRYCTLENNLRYLHDSDESEEELEEGVENEDMLEEVPVNLDPEQLGFLLCAQETLRFLQERGLALGDPMVARLRRHFARGIHHIALA